MHKRCSACGHVDKTSVNINLNLIINVGGSIKSIIDAVKQILKR